MRNADAGEALEWLIREGEAAAFCVLLEGRLAVMKFVAGLDEQINTYVPGDFVPLLIGSPAVAGLQALQSCRVARLDGRDFRELIAQCDALSGAVMRAMAGRVEHLQQISAQATGPAVTVIGSRLDLACHDVRDSLARNNVPYNRWDPGGPVPRMRSAAQLPRASSSDGHNLDQVRYAGEVAGATGIQPRRVRGPSPLSAGP